MKKVLVLLVVICLVPAAFGCKKASEKMAEKAIEKAMESESGEKADVDISEGKISIKSKETGEEGIWEMSGKGGLDLPDDFPSDVPVYPDAELVSSLRAAGGINLVFISKDESEKIRGFYKDGFEDSGWEIIQEMKMPNAYSLGAEKGDMQAVVMIADSDDGNNITITVTREEE